MSAEPTTGDPGTPAEGVSDAEPVAETDEEPALNRAARRAKKKGTPSAQPTGRGKIAGRPGAAHGPRLWANRRSG